MYYICEICNKAFTTNQNYNRHINNQNIHTKIQDIDLYKYKCDCGKKYLHQSSLHKHKKQCNQIINQPESTFIELKDKFEKEKEELQKQVELEKQNKTIETQNNDYLNIQINAFGCENLEHITDTFKVKCLKQIYKSIPEMVTKIHFNTKKFKQYETDMKCLDST